jgi:hypothetical protein
MEYESLPTAGPGYAANGNFVLTEIELRVEPVPEPAGVCLVIAGLSLLSVFTRRRRLQSKPGQRAALDSAWVREARMCPFVARHVDPSGNTEV